MTKKERAKLRACIRQICASLLSSGGRITTAQVREMVINELPREIEDAKERLFNESITAMIRSVLKETVREDDEPQQVPLFGNLDPDLKIPKSIAVPSLDNPREMVWASIRDATINELRAYVSYLQKGAAADSAKAKQLSVFADKVMEIATTDDVDTPIGEMLQGFRRTGTA